MYVWRNFEAVHVNIVGESSITYSECLPVALIFLHFMRVWRIVLPSVSCPDLRYSSTLSYKRHDFLRNVY
jgi:hypothetical protein